MAARDAVAVEAFSRCDRWAGWRPAVSSPSPAAAASAGVFPIVAAAADATADAAPRRFAGRWQAGATARTVPVIEVAPSTPLSPRHQ
jgi:hypothetical protein